MSADPTSEPVLLKRKRGRPFDSRHSDRARARIQTSMLIRRLHDHVLDKVSMTPTQVKAAEILLRKTVPDLSAVALATNGAAIIEQQISNLEIARRVLFEMDLAERSKLLTHEPEIQSESLDLDSPAL